MGGAHKSECPLAHNQKIPPYLWSTVKDSDYFKPQIEVMHATGTNSFAEDLEAEMRTVEPTAVTSLPLCLSERLMTRWGFRVLLANSASRIDISIQKIE